MFFRIRGVSQCNDTILLTFMKILQYLKETKNELKEVVFPTTSQTIAYTVIVILISAIVALALGGVDIGLREALAKIVAL